MLLSEKTQSSDNIKIITKAFPEADQLRYLMEFLQLENSIFLEKNVIINLFKRNQRKYFNALRNKSMVNLINTRKHSISNFKNKILFYFILFLRTKIIF